MRPAIEQAIKDRIPFTAIALIDGQYQGWGVFNPVYTKEQ